MTPQPNTDLQTLVGPLQLDAAALLGDGRVNMVIGYQRRGERCIPALLTDARAVDVLTFDSQCLQNLAAYLHKEEVRQKFPVAVVASPATMRSLVLLAAESQLPDDAIVVLALDETRYLGAFDLEATARLLNESYPNLALPAETLKRVAELAALSPQERAAFWSRHFERCTRCYACRAACPSCYCKQCIVEKNTPQWISTAAREHGNYAWQVIRAFHSAGRCTACGACERACPQGIPLMLLNVKVSQEVVDQFNAKPGYDPQAKPVIGSWKPDDKQEFIR